MSIHTPTHASSEHNTADQINENLTEQTDELANETGESESEHENEFSPALLFLEDFVLTSVLSAGKALRTVELGSRATDWILPKRALSGALKNAKSLAETDRTWDAKWREAGRTLSREERLRRPIETALHELLLAVGKPLPTPVLARELDLIRNVPDPNLKTAVGNVLKNARWALEVAPGVWLHQDFVFKIGAPTEELLIKENDLGSDPDFQGLMQFAEITATDAAGIARELMEFTGGPLNQKVIGFFVHRANPSGFSPLALATVLNDRTKFQPLIGGFVTLQEQLGSLKELTQEYLEDLESPVEAADLQALLQQAISQGADAPATQNAASTEENAPPEPAPENEALSETELSELRRLALAGESEIFNVAQGVLALHDFQTDDPQFVAAIGKAIAALQNDTQHWISLGEGQFTLREKLPEGIGAPHAILWPYPTELTNPATGTLFDFDLADEQLDAQSVAFIHDPQWEDIGEEHEVLASVPTTETTKVVVLNHHRRAGTIKMRRADETVFAFEGPFAPIQVRDETEDETFEVWASRETGLLLGLGQWCEEHLPPSGGTVCFTRGESGLAISFEPPHAATFLTERRVDELENLAERAANLSLFEMVCELFRAAKGGLEIESLWAQSNAVRRTSKRTLCSVLNGYGCFSQAPNRAGKTVWMWDGKGAETLKA